MVLAQIKMFSIRELLSLTIFFCGLFLLGCGYGLLVSAFRSFDNILKEYKIIIVGLYTSIKP